MSAPKMEYGTVEMVSVEWIMKNADYSVDGFVDGDYLDPGVDYQAMLTHKTQDGGFGDLVGTILERGFRVPIVLDTGTGYAIAHGNGHHRMCAAILLCLDEIPVYWAHGDYMSDHASDTEPTIHGTDFNGLEHDLGWQLFGEEW